MVVCSKFISSYLRERLATIGKSYKSGDLEARHIDIGDLKESNIWGAVVAIDINLEKIINLCDWEYNVYARKLMQQNTEDNLICLKRSIEDCNIKLDSIISKSVYYGLAERMNYRIVSIPDETNEQ